MADSTGVLNLPFADNVKSALLPKIASWVAPKNLGFCVRLVPQLVNRKVIESVLNRVLQEQVADGDFDYLTGKWLQVEIRDAQLFVTLGFHNGHFVCREVVRESCEANAYLSVMTVDAIDMVQHKVDPDTLFFQRKLNIAGDTELAHHVKNTLDTLDPEAIPKVVLTLLQYYQAIISKPAI